GIVLITHKLREVLGCADRIMVMRQGRVAGLIGRNEATEENLLALMFGETPTRPAPALDANRHDRGETVLELIQVSTAGDGGAVPLREIGMTLRSGEVIGIAGVSGNGQREICDLVLGLHRPQKGIKRLWGEDASSWSIAKVRASGVAAIPEDPLSL